MKSHKELNSLLLKFFCYVLPDLMRDETGDLANEVYFSNLIVSLKTTNWHCSPVNPVQKYGQPGINCNKKRSMIFFVALCM